MKSKKKLFLMGLILLLIGLILAILLIAGRTTHKKDILVGFVTTGSIDEIGWNGIHYQAVQKACDNLDVKLMIKENIKEFSGTCRGAVQELIDEGASMIILNSYGYAQEIYSLIARNPQVAFYLNASEGGGENVTTYFVRMYQARYLAGIVAGKQTRSGQIGYVVAMNNSEVNRGIDAFTLGVRSVNPDAEVCVYWTGSWDDEAAEKEAVRKLVENKKIDVVTYHQNGPYVVEAAEEAGIYSIAYHQAYSDYSEKCLTAAVGNWDLVYTDLIRELVQGKGNNETNYWVGLERSAVGLAPYSSAVSEETKELVEQAIERISSGKDVFSGEIYDIDGVQRCASGEMISDEVLLDRLDWFVEGVVFYEE